MLMGTDTNWHRWQNGSGVDAINVSSYEWAVENLPLFDSSDDDLVAAGENTTAQRSTMNLLENTDGVHRPP